MELKVTAKKAKDVEVVAARSHRKSEWTRLTPAIQALPVGDVLVISGFEKGAISKARSSLASWLKKNHNDFTANYSKDGGSLVIVRQAPKAKTESA